MNWRYTYLSYMLYVLCSAVYIHTCEADPLLVVLLMVKNEEHVICPTLEPFVQEGVNSFCILDTGSTDDTIKVVREYAQEHNLADLYVFEEPFIDFATSRNHLIDIGHAVFPYAAFFIMPDAEWYLEGVEDLMRFCQREISIGSDCNRIYHVLLKTGSISFYQARLFRNVPDIYFIGEIHECIPASHYCRLPDTVFFDVRVTPRGIEKTRERWKRDKVILLKKHEENPHDTRSVFYLAQTCECLGEHEQAYEYYHKRAQLIGWDEEDFMSWYRLAGVVKSLSQSNEEYTWDMALHFYLKSFSVRPQRIEPLVQIAEYYWLEHNYALCYLFSKRACEIAYPDDMLFVEQYFYDWYRYDLLGRCAWYIGEYEVGEWAVRKALEAKPHEEYLMRNLIIYLEKKNNAQT